MREYPSFEFIEDYGHEWHNVITVTLGELYEDNWFDPTDETWQWDWYNEDQYYRVCNKFIDHYWDREIGILPPGKWKRRYVNLMNEIMPKYKFVYKMLDDGINILMASDIYSKNRRIYSEFPATQIQADVQDYAANANDYESETITYNDWISTLERLRRYKDPDLMIIEECDPLFSCFYTVNTNTYL